MIVTILLLAIVFIGVSALSATARELPFAPEINGFKVMESGRVAASLSFLKPEKLYKPGEAVSFKIDSASDSRIRRLKMTVSAKGRLNAILEREIVLERGKDAVDSFSVGSNGVFTVTIAFLDSEGRVAGEGRIDIGSMPRNTRSDDTFHWGIESRIARLSDWKDCFIEGYDEKAARDILLNYIDATGVDLVRDGSTFANAAPEEGRYDFGTTLRLARDLSSRRILLDWVITGTPDWAVSEKYWGVVGERWRMPPDPEKWRSFVEGIKLAFGDTDNILHEIYNEPNATEFNGGIPGFWLGTRDEYFEILGTAARTLRSKSVMNGGIIIDSENGNHKVNGSEREYFEHFRAGLNDSPLYAIAVHSHGPIDFLHENWKNLTSFEDGALPIILNESGDPGIGGRSLEDIAVSVAGKAVWAKARGFAGYVAFHLGAVSGMDAGSEFAMVGEKLEPRPALLQYMQAIRMLSGALPKRTFVEGAGRYAWLFSNGTADIAVLIGVSPREAGFDDSGYRMYDAYGNPTETRSEGITYYVAGELPVLPSPTPFPRPTPNESEGKGCSTAYGESDTIISKALLLVPPLLVILAKKRAK